MEMQRKNSGRATIGRNGEKGRIVNVALPTPYEGVGRALRATYRAGPDSLPDDMMNLLAKLDRH